MTSRRPIRIPRREERDSFGGHRLERILGYVPGTPGPVSAIVDIPGGHAPGEHGIRHVAAYVDATFPTPVYVSEGTTAVHILWTAPGSRAEVLAGLDPFTGSDLIGHEAQPGDTVSVPAGLPFALGAGIVAFVFSSQPPRISTDPAEWARTPIPHPPGHGLNLFDRFNRRTICAAHGDLLLERWKVSHPLDLDLDLELDARRWHYLTNLVEPVALNWPGGSELLGRTASRLLPAGTGRITIIPDGLGYILIGSVPDLARDVISPLRRAGYDQSAIASIGMADHLLE